MDKLQIAIEKLKGPDPEKELLISHDEGILPISYLERYHGRHLPRGLEFESHYLAKFDKDFNSRHELAKHLRVLAEEDENGGDNIHVLIHTIFTEWDLKTEAYLFIKNRDLEKDFLDFVRRFRDAQSHKYIDAY